MGNFPPEKENRKPLDEANPVDDTYILEEHLTELFAELFRSHLLLEIKIRQLQVEIELLKEKIDSLVGG